MGIIIQAKPKTKKKNPTEFLAYRFAVKDSTNRRIKNRGPHIGGEIVSHQRKIWTHGLMKRET